MKTWKSKRSVCRGSKSGKFASKGRCKAYKKTKVRRPPRNSKGQFKLW